MQVERHARKGAGQIIQKGLRPDQSGLRPETFIGDQGERFSNDALGDRSGRIWTWVPRMAGDVVVADDQRGERSRMRHAHHNSVAATFVRDGNVRG